MPRFFHCCELFLVTFLTIVLCLFSAITFAKTPYLDVYPVISGDKRTQSFRLAQIGRLKGIDGMNERDVARINAIPVVLPINDFQPRQYVQGDVIKKAVLIALEQHHSTLVYINVPPRVVLKFKADVDVSASAVAVAKKALEEHLKKYYRKSDIKLAVVPDLKYDGELRFVPRNIVGLVKARTAVWVDAYEASRLIQSIPVWFEVKAKMDVLVLKAAVSRGEVVSPTHFVVESKDITTLPVEVVQVNEISDDRFGDFLYAVDVSEQVILDRRLIRKVKAVNFGEDVKVISKSGHVSIMANAIAQGSAEIGDSVKLMAIESKEIFTGKVTARKQVVVDANP